MQQNPAHCSVAPLAATTSCARSSPPSNELSQVTGDARAQWSVTCTSEQPEFTSKRIWPCTTGLCPKTDGCHSFCILALARVSSPDAGPEAILWKQVGQIVCPEDD